MSSGVSFRMASGATRDCGFVDRNLNLLAHAQAIELEIGSRCGGHGICGGDRVRVRAADASGLSPLTQAEREHLSGDEIAAGWRLACQCFPQRSGAALVLDVPGGAALSADAPDAADAPGAAVTIRHARPEDDARIGELLVEAFVTAYGRKMPEVVVHDRRKADLRDVAGKRAHAAVFVAEMRGEVVGTVTLLRPSDPGSRAWTEKTSDLRYMAVDPRFHGLGISRPLLERCEEQAREWGARAICLHVRRGAHGVARLYERRGYVRAPEGDSDQLPDLYLEAYLKSV